MIKLVKYIMVITMHMIYWWYGREYNEIAWKLMTRVNINKYMPCEWYYVHYCDQRDIDMCGHGVCALLGRVVIKLWWLFK